MTTPTGQVGALTLPVPVASPTTAKLTDPVVEAILDYLAWSLNTDLSMRLAQLTGTSTTAVPTANRFTFDPFEPRGHSVRRPVPALFVWWDGTSTPYPFSQLHNGRQRTISVMYIFDELPALAEMDRRSGLMAAVEASVVKALDRRHHPSYSYNSMPLGTPIDESVGDAHQWDVAYLGGQGIQRVGIDDTSTTPALDRPSGRHYPAFVALLRVRELVQPVQPSAPDGELHDSLFTIKNDGVTIMERVLEAPDGQGAPEV
jgi:hypothetical protein